MMIYANTLTEGCSVSLFSPEQQDVIVKLFLSFNEYYPAPVLESRVTLFKKFLDKTYFAWIGEFGDEDAFYYRIHSPVAFMELDFHCGSKCLDGLIDVKGADCKIVFLTNTSPARCHIHTVNRLPNRGDYGKALLDHRNV